jgi:hypothetical protein
LARDFSDRIQRVLNTTVCTGIRIASVVSADPSVVNVGHGLAKSKLVTERIRVCQRARRPKCWLDVQYKLSLDDAGEYLMVQTSFFGLYAADDDQSCLCHFDYERDKSSGYPEAHLQVYGESVALSNWRGAPRTRDLKRIHFPAGGRRYRTILEDVIEFMIVEQLADPCDAWEDVLAAERREFQRIQLRAAIRGDPETARRMVQELD